MKIICNINYNTYYMLSNIMHIMYYDIYCALIRIYYIVCIII